MVEPQKDLESVEAETGLGQEIEENCRRYTDDQHKLVCLSSSRNAVGHLINGLNNEARNDAFMANSELKNAEKEFKEEIEKPERIPTPDIGEPTIINKRK